MADTVQLHTARTFEIDPDPARSWTLPGWAYTDPAVLEREKREIFYKTWHYAGAVDELKEPGDYVTAKLLDQSVIVIRGKDGGLRGFYNVCQHRAHELLRGRGRATAIVCPYHAWSFDTAGALRTARGAEKLENFRREDFALKEIRVEVFAKHFVMFNLDLDAVPLAEQAGDLAAELEAEIPGFADFVQAGTAWDQQVKANWKVVVDNYLECYHCRPAHPAFADLVDMKSYKIHAGGIWSSQKGAMGRHDNKAYPVAADAKVQLSRFWWLWPTTSFNVTPGQPSLNVFCMMPVETGVARQWGQLFEMPGNRPDPARQTYGVEVLGPEDVGLCEAVQRGLQSRGYTAGRFIHDPEGGETTEAAVHHFHKMVDEALGMNGLK